MITHRSPSRLVIVAGFVALSHGRDVGAQALDCSRATPLACSQIVSATTAGEPSRGASYPCAPTFTFDGPERIFSFTAATAQQVSFLLRSAIPDLDVMVIPADAPAGCNTSFCTARADARLIHYDLAAGNYYVVVDGRSGAQGDFDLVAICDNRLTPELVTATQAPTGTDCLTESKTLFLNNLASVDLVFVVDTTAGQNRALTRLPAWTTEIIDRLRPLVPSLQVSLLSYRDYPGSYSNLPECDYETVPYGRSPDFPYRLELPLTADTALLSAAVAGLTIGDGGDLAEAATRALYETYSDPAIGGRPGTTRVVVNFSDAGPHDCDYLRCGTPTVAVGNVWGRDPGPDAAMFTADDLDLLPVLDEMAARGMALFHVFTGPAEIGGIPNPVRPAFMELWSCWTARARGSAFDSNPTLDTTALADAIYAVSTPLASCGEVHLAASSGYDAWLRTLTPSSYSTVVPPEALAFDVELCAPTTATPGLNTFTVKALCDGVEVAEQVVEIDVIGSSDCASAVADSVVSPLSVCAGEPVALGAGTSRIPGCATTEYRWRGTPGYLRDWSTTADAVANPTESTSYELDLRCLDFTCELSSVPVLVGVRPSPTADAGLGQSLCVGSTASIGGAPTGSGGTGALDYIWSETPADPSMTCRSGPSCSNPDVSPTVTTSYTVIVRDVTGCESTATTFVAVGTPGPAVDVGNSLRVVKDYLATPAAPDVMRFTWTEVGGAVVIYNLRRADAKDFSAPNDIIAAAPAGQSIARSGELLPPPTPRFYRLTSSNCAGEESPF